MTNVRKSGPLKASGHFNCFIHFLKSRNYSLSFSLYLHACSLFLFFINQRCTFHNLFSVAFSVDSYFYYYYFKCLHYEGDDIHGESSANKGRSYFLCALVTFLRVTLLFNTQMAQFAVAKKNNRRQRCRASKRRGIFLNLFRHLRAKAR